MLKRIFGEQFEVSAGQATVLEQEKKPIVVEETPGLLPVPGAAMETGASDPATTPLPEGSTHPEPETSAQTQFSSEALAGSPAIEPKGKGQLSSDRVENPHDPEAAYAVKGQGQQKKGAS